MHLRHAFPLALAGLMAAGLTLQPAPAAACGGFFCDNNQPVNQQAERIIFAQEPDGTVTAVIQIQYAGPSERFAWMLPVSGRPDIAVSSNAAFTRLQAVSNPIYQLNDTVEGTCRADDFAFGGGAPPSDLIAADMGTADPGPPNLPAPDQRPVGPYPFVRLSSHPAPACHHSLAVRRLTEHH